MVGDPGAPEPAAPERARRVDARRRVVDVGRAVQGGRPRQRAEGSVALLEPMAATDGPSLHAEGQVGVQAHREVPAPGPPTPSARWPSSPVQRPRRRSAAVAEGGLADQLELDGPGQAHGGPHQQVLGVVVRGRPGVGGRRVAAGARAHDERVAHLQPAGRCVPRRDQHVRPGFVVPRVRHGDPVGAEAEISRAAIEQGPEHAGAVEPRGAEPLDRPVGCHQRARVAVGEKGVLGDRGERGRARVHR